MCFDKWASLRPIPQNFQLPTSCLDMLHPLLSLCLHACMSVCTYLASLWVQGFAYVKGKLLVCSLKGSTHRNDLSTHSNRLKPSER